MTWMPCCRCCRPPSSRRSGRRTRATTCWRSSWIWAVCPRRVSWITRSSSARKKSPLRIWTCVISHIGEFTGDNRAGIERTLHRISCIRNRQGRIIGLTCRVGRAVYGVIDIIEDIVKSGQSILLLGQARRGQDDAPARGGARPGREEARDRGRYLQRDRRRRRHPASGDRPRAAHAGGRAGASARGDDRGGREPHAAR